MQQLEKDFASVIPALEEAVPTTPGMWTFAVCAGFVAATLKPDELADLGPEPLAGLQAFFIEALLPELVVEEVVDVGRGVQTGRKD